ncbi:endonuclease/exonuclease/phosphatase family protein [Flavobacterium sp. N3904]|uniref:endonuclease/exonuclease/phosphatase family protein n=1 Tax=Flavobacterium sp. N3904 TaxID=2986835 RepID=UPI002224DD39|nr:endonuclease/exonuclease/phosphatase family protein [Flavobacterium sp. N3904]
MKIITWNCNMAFRKKAEFVLAHQPDILIIQECEHPDKLKFDKGIPLPSDLLWYGKNQHKGLGVFSYSDYRFTLLDCHNPNFKNILPIAVRGGKVDFILFAVWANNPEDKDGQYVTQVWKAIQYYDFLLSDKKCILIGDFNSNTIWDKPRRDGNHSTVVSILESKNIYSAYHKFHNQIQGKEMHATFSLYRHEDKPYHLDYCFASNKFIEALENVEVGTHTDWSKYSDHQPLLIKFAL